MQILIADDSDIVRRGVIDILSEESELAVCGGGKSGAEALQKALELKLDFILLNVSMPDVSGLEMAHLLQKEYLMGY